LVLLNWFWFIFGLILALVSVLFFPLHAAILFSRDRFAELPAVLSSPEESTRFIRSLLPDFDAQFQDMLGGCTIGMI
jgi:hypothetical protein